MSISLYSFLDWCDAFFKKHRLQPDYFIINGSGEWFSFDTSDFTDVYAFRLDIDGTAVVAGNAVAKLSFSHGTTDVPLKAGEKFEFSHSLFSSDLNFRLLLPLGLVGKVTLLRKTK